jgi:hypothetical protein
MVIRTIMSKLTVRIFDGSRQLFAAPGSFLVTLIDGNGKQQFRNNIASPQQSFDLPFFDNFGDNYSVIAFRDGFRQAGFAPVKLSKAFDTTLDIMLIPNDPGFSFVNARWPAVSGLFPFLGGDTDPATAEARYENLADQHEPTVACFLNLCEAMGAIRLAQGTPLDFFKQIRWDKPPQGDRFFAWCDARLLDQVQAAADKGLFAPEHGAAIFHPGATRSWKQVEFGEANVQLTFHENDADRKVIDGVECVTVEPDIDYYRDPAAHTILEVIPNGLTHSLTDPIQVYILRWIAGRHAGVPDFNPLYTLTP